MGDITRTFGGDTLAQKTDAALHKLWTKAVGTDGYVKAEWKELEQGIFDLIKRGKPKRVHMNLSEGQVFDD